MSVGDRPIDPVVCVLCQLFPEQVPEHATKHHKLDIQDGELVRLPIEPPPSIHWNAAQLAGRADAAILDAEDPYQNESLFPGFTEWWDAPKREALREARWVLPPYGQYGRAMRAIWDVAYFWGREAGRAEKKTEDGP